MTLDAGGMNGQRTIRMILDDAQRRMRNVAGEPLADQWKELGEFGGTGPKPESAWACGGCEQAQGAGGLDRLGPAVRAELGVDVAHVGLDGTRGDGQLGGHLRC
jgi:hypothetical protein